MTSVTSHIWTLELDLKVLETVICTQRQYNLRHKNHSKENNSTHGEIERRSGDKI